MTEPPLDREKQMRVALALNHQMWKVAPDERYAAWQIRSSDGVVLGGFASEIHARGAVQTHNDWLHRFRDMVSYRKAYWWAMFGTAVAALIFVIDAAVHRDSWGWAFAGAGTVATGFAMAMAVSRFEKGE